MAASPSVTSAFCSKTVRNDLQREKEVRFVPRLGFSPTSAEKLLSPVNKACSFRLLPCEQANKKKRIPLESSTAGSSHYCVWTFYHRGSLLRPLAAPSTKPSSTCESSLSESTEYLCLIVVVTTILRLSGKQQRSSSESPLSTPNARVY